MMRDAVGNEVKEGDLVFVSVGTIWLKCSVVKYTEGGTVIPFNKQQSGVMPDKLMLQFELQCVDAQPGQNHPAINRLINPETEIIMKIKKEIIA